jgi:hypothetical protein
VTNHSVDELRGRLRELGYLSHGIERWFALDPWSSRTFWVELLLVALKAAILLCLFGALPMVAVMLVRNGPLTGGETLIMTGVYAGNWLACAFAVIVLVALLLKLRPSIAIDTPRGLLAISLTAAGLLASGIGVWWSHFETPATAVELALGLVLSVAFFLVSTVVISAALLSFSIYELQRIPTIHQRSRTLPIGAAAAVLVALLFLPAYAQQEHAPAAPPQQILTRPTERKIAVLAVDGLTWEILQTRPRLAGAMISVLRASRLDGASAAERWASAGTGTTTREHAVRAIEGLQLAGGPHVIQSVSRADLPLRQIAESLGLARRRPLPPTVRRRDYVWEIVAGRGLTAAAVDWWTSEQTTHGPLEAVPQEKIFAAAAARGNGAATAVAIDAISSRTLLELLHPRAPQLAAVYLPALDVLLNRLTLDPAQRLTGSVRALDSLEQLVATLRARGRDVIVIGLPGDGQSGAAVLAATIPLESNRAVSPFDLAPTVLDLLSFPAAQEMPGRSLLPGSTQERIPSFGSRKASVHSSKVDEEYYQNLRSLGYVR